MNEEELDQLLVFVGHLHYKYAHSKFAHLGVPGGQPRFLRYLTEHEGCRQRDLASKFELEPATVTAALRRMEKAGLIERRPDKQDLRVSCVWLTEEGRRLVNQLETTRREIARSCFGSFTPDDRAALGDALRKVETNLRRMLEDPAQE